MLVGHSQQRPASDLHIRVYKVVLLVSSAPHGLPLVIPALKHVRSEPLKLSRKIHSRTTYKYQLSLIDPCDKIVL